MRLTWFSTLLVTLSFGFQTIESTTFACARSPCPKPTWPPVGWTPPPVDTTPQVDTNSPISYRVIDDKRVEVTIRDSEKVIAQMDPKSKEVVEKLLQDYRDN